MKAAAFVFIAITFGIAEGVFYWPEGLGFHCFLPCLHSLDPVCGSDGNTLQTFENSCKLRLHSCWTKKAYHEIKLGECTGREDVRIFDDKGNCPQIWDPVCGTDDVEIRTFPNQCILHSFNLNHKQYFRLVDEGECEKRILQKQQEKSCLPCAKIYWPVCGREGSTQMTFPNQCVMRSYNCYESRNFTELKNEEC